MEKIDIHYDFAYEVADRVYFDMSRITNPNYSVTIVGKRDEIKECIKEFICLGADIGSITLADPSWENYDGEYYLCVCNEDGDVVIDCDKAISESCKFYRDEANITFVFDNVKSRIIPCCGCNIMYIVRIEDEDELFDCDFECDEYEECEPDECAECEFADKCECRLCN